MGYLVPPPPPKFIQYNAGYYVNPGWHFSVAKSTLEEKPKTLDEIIEDESRYDPLAEIKAGRLSLIEDQRKKPQAGVSKVVKDHFEMFLKGYETANDTGPK